MIVGLVTTPVFAGAVHSLVITEVSSTSLTATFDGSSLVVNFEAGFPDQWLIVLPSTFVPGIDEQQWTEPENSGLVNRLAFNPSMRDIPPSIDVISDFPLDNQKPVTADGTTVDVGTDGGVPVFATFTDNDAGSEAAPTMSLLFLALTALLSASRLRSCQSASSTLSSAAP